MRPISTKHKEIINSDPYYKVCARKNDDCGGRRTIEHSLIYAGKQIAELWNYIPLCERHHGLGQFSDCKFLRKDINEKLALQRATREEIAENYPRLLWKWKKYNENSL